MLFAYQVYEERKDIFKEVVGYDKTLTTEIVLNTVNKRKLILYHVKNPPD